MFRFLFLSRLSHKQPCVSFGQLWRSDKKTMQASGLQMAHSSQICSCHENTNVLERSFGNFNFSCGQLSRFVCPGLSFASCPPSHFYAPSLPGNDLFTMSSMTSMGALLSYPAVCGNSWGKKVCVALSGEDCLEFKFNLQRWLTRFNLLYLVTVRIVADQR